MAKRVHVGVPGVRINETDHRVLASIAQLVRRGNGVACKPYPVSHRELRVLTQASEGSVLRSCKALERCGLVVVEPQFLETGAQAASFFALTALGLEVLRLADEKTNEDA